jgi:hypothetical protein
MSQKPSEILAQQGESGGMAPKPPRAPRNPKAVRPDGSVEPDTGITKGAKTDLIGQLENLQAMAEEKLASGAPMRVLDKHGETAVSGDIEKQSEEAQQAIFDKVARFLDPKLRGPIFTFALEARNKFFVGRFPTQNEMLDVQRGAHAVGREVSDGDILYGIVGELLKAIIGWYPLNSPEVQMFRAHINDPKQWPQMQPKDWLDSRDPYVTEDEIIPLFQAYSKWKIEVQPTRDEIAFYYSRVT